MINISTYIITIYIYIRYAFYIYFPLLFMYIDLYVQHLYVHWGGGSKVTEPEALETKIKEITIQT